MTTINKLLFILSAALWLSCAAPTHAQEARNGVQVKLSLADNKSVYRMGEPIRLVMEFTADEDGYQVDTVPERSDSLSDSISVTPESGVHHWLEEYLGGNRYPRCVVSFTRLTKAPTRLELFLNDSVRFDRPGRYSVKVTTRRVSQISSSPAYSPTAALTTNEVSFQVQPMSVADEEREVKRISDLLETARGWQAEAKLAEELSFLTGDASSREKVRRFLNPKDGPGNYAQHITYGLFIARNRALVLRLLESAIRDPKIPVTFQLLGALSRLRSLEDNNGVRVRPVVTAGILSPTAADPKSREILEAYLTELTAGLGRRTGPSQTTTAMTILMHLPKEQQGFGATLDEVRRVLLQQFDSLHPFSQEYLLRVYWEQLRDPSLIPSLKKTLAYAGVSSKNVRDSALRRLIEVAPEEARPFVISEIRDPASLVDLEILGSLADKSLPEVDEALLEQIRRYASSKAGFDSTFLRHKVSLASRYATNGIYAELMQIYQSTKETLPLESRAGLLAYLARYNEAEALPLIEQTLGEISPGQDFNFLPKLTSLYYSDGIGALVVRRLEGDEPQAASLAAYILSLHGSAADMKLLEARLERWRKEWGHRAAEAESNLQGTVEQELILALTRAKGWKLAPERVRELQRSCITQLCRQTFRVQ